jgi:LmbE family N-acetylglucosaminyl deacetylase
MNRILIAAAACLSAVILSTAANHNAYPIPEERGTAGILQSLERLPVSARVLWVQAHPDDESAGTITWLARRAHVRTAIYSFTHGEGGQNILGDEKYGDFALNRALRKRGLKRMFLHAASVSLRHPATGEMLTIRSPLPADLAAFRREVFAEEAA